jgi:hypothetical protein
MEWKAINKEGRHVGLDFYDLLIEGHYAQNPQMRRQSQISQLGLDLPDVFSLLGCLNIKT